MEFNKTLFDHIYEILENELSDRVVQNRQAGYIIVKSLSSDAMHVLRLERTV